MPERVHIVIAGREEQRLTYQYMCREGDAAPPLAAFAKEARSDALRETAERLWDALLRSVRLRRSSPEELQYWGGMLYDALIPRDLADAFRDSEAKFAAFYLEPELASIPWELLWDGEQFLCQRFSIGRALQKTADERQRAERRLRQERAGRGALVVFGDVTGLQADRERADIERILSRMCGSQVWFLPRKGAAETVQHLKRDYEICHFVGHGTYDPEGDRTGWKLADGTVLICRDIESVTSHASFPLLVFANSCDSARPSLSEAEGYVRTLYRAFLRQGVPHYIGTIAPVPDIASREFAEVFYRLLAQGLGVGAALGGARQVFAERPGVPIWALSVHYGDPTHRLHKVKESLRSEALKGEAWQPVVREKTSFAVLGRATKQELRQMVAERQSAVARNPQDAEAHYALALCHLQLGEWDPSRTHLQCTLELAPDFADAHYYSALALMRGRKPKLLSLSEVRQIEDHLRAARELDSEQAKYYWLAGIVKLGYYVSNGLVIRPPSPDELFHTAEQKPADPWEMERLLSLVPLREEQRMWYAPLGDRGIPT